MGRGLLDGGSAGRCGPGPAGRVGGAAGAGPGDGGQRGGFALTGGAGPVGSVLGGDGAEQPGGEGEGVGEGGALAGQRESAGPDAFLEGLADRSDLPDRRGPVGQSPDESAVTARSAGSDG
ncbi:hypothetical protein [Kitasatospora sp. NPDC094011]|uniref:hypothetical protein n=1 Tax=Kitasatospora sp. NPDC094011 TaxID=3364090 RepID=UPI0038056780